MAKASPRFAEKPEDSKSFINGGFFLSSKPEAIDRIEGRRKRHGNASLASRLLRTVQLEAYVHEGYWQCVDTLHELRLLRNAWNDGEAPWKTWS